MTMIKTYICDWCGKEFQDRGKVFPAGTNVHYCHKCIKIYSKRILADFVPRVEAIRIDNEGTYEYIRSTKVLNEIADAVVSIRRALDDYEGIS